MKYKLNKSNNLFQKYHIYFFCFWLGDQHNSNKHTLRKGERRGQKSNPESHIKYPYNQTTGTKRITLYPFKNNCIIYSTFFLCIVYTN